MSWSVNNIYECLKFFTRKNQSGNITPDNLFYAWNVEQNMYYQDIVGRWEARSNGKQGVNTGMIRNEIILTDLAPFTIPATIAIVSGNADKPLDFIYTNDLRKDGIKIVHITNDQIPAVTDSVIDPPSVTASTYYYTEYQGYYYLLPRTLTGNVTLDYVASVTDIVWGHTTDADGRYIYDPSTSIQPKWNQSTIVTITKRALTNLGVSFKDADFTSFGRTAQLSGN